MWPIQMLFCSLLRFSDIWPVLHSVEFISEGTPEKLPGHFPPHLVALVLKGFKISERVPTCKRHNVSCPFIEDEALSVTSFKRSSQTRGWLTQRNANVGTPDLVSLKCHVSFKARCLTEIQ